MIYGLRYKKISNNSLLDQYKKQITSPVVLGSSQTITIIKKELSKAFSGLTGLLIKYYHHLANQATFIAGTVSTSTIISSIVTKDELDLSVTKDLLLDQQYHGKN